MLTVSQVEKTNKTSSQPKPGSHVLASHKYLEWNENSTYYSLLSAIYFLKLEYSRYQIQLDSKQTNSKAVKPEFDTVILS